MNASKSHGRIYTPDYLVKTILDYAGYNTPENILTKHVIDNSCGDGAFLTEIVKRYTEAFAQSPVPSTETLKQHLETYIHGIEIDRQECLKCRENLDQLVAKFGIDKVKWDIICADTLTVHKFDGKIDYIVGNPPYVRVHNLNQNYNAVKQFRFAQGGMTDLYVVFFEIGFRMMAPNAVMCLITPSSWLSSVAGGVLRKYILTKQCLNGVIDLAHFQPFKATTYTLISRFANSRSEEIEYNTFNPTTLSSVFKCNIPFTEIAIGKAFYLADRQTLNSLRKIRTEACPQRVRVKNGFATLADSIFIGNWNFSGMTIDVVKSSTGKWYKCIFPYNSHAKPIPLETIEKEYPDVYAYYRKHEFALRKEDSSKIGSKRHDQSIENNSWYLFGRSQAIKDVWNDKIAINAVIKDVNSIKLTPSTKGTGVYGGLYILSNVDYAKIEEVIRSQEYVSYIATLKNYKSGGYYTCSAKDIELYINYKLAQNNE